MTNTAAIRVGRVLEIRIDAGYASVAEVDELFDAVSREVTTKLTPSQKLVTVTDWRNCPVMSSEAAERALGRMTRNNPRVERSAALVSPVSPSAVLQFLRLVRESNNPDRRLFQTPEALFSWLDEVVTAPESIRIRQFLAESSAATTGQRR